MSNPTPPVLETDELRPVFLKLAPKDIVFVRAIFESYEGIAEIRTMNPETGIIVVLALKDTVEEVRRVVKDLESEMTVREIPVPDEVKGDWLLEEYYSKGGID